MCLYSYASTEDRLLIALSRLELLGMYSAKAADLFYAFYAYTYILRTRWTRQSAICARRKNRAQFITGLCHRQPSNKGLRAEAELRHNFRSERWYIHKASVSGRDLHARPRISLTFHWKRRTHRKNLWTLNLRLCCFVWFSGFWVLNRAKGCTFGPETLLRVRFE